MSTFTFLRDLKQEITEHGTSTAAAALAYYLTLSIFPSLILLLSSVAYLPISHLDQAILDSLREFLPESVAAVLTSVIYDVVGHKRGSLLSFGALATLWAASSGTLAVMEQLNLSYEVKDARSFFKLRGIAIGLSLCVGASLLTALSLIVVGEGIQSRLAEAFSLGPLIPILFQVFRWLVIVMFFLFAFALTYYLGPDVEQKFKFITPGSLLGTMILIGASFLFRLYVAQFSDYNATYGSIGAVIVLMLWLYITGWVILGGSELNALLEHYSCEGKNKGEKQEPHEWQATCIRKR